MEGPRLARGTVRRPCRERLGGGPETDGGLVIHSAGMVLARAPHDGIPVLEFVVLEIDLLALVGRPFCNISAGTTAKEQVYDFFFFFPPRARHPTAFLPLCYSVWVRGPGCMAG